MKKTVSVTMEPSQHERLEQLAKEDFSTVSALIRKAIDNYLKSREVKTS